ncbi:hypothetical protein WJX72_005316 [[Myrmecia] bisecta]|uniref:C2HC/C3H-type domain-containing protein n=1 Tax=[Myrmecia] bisecta TaxID=41462 RepID=A0AAW1QF53_9CHLO
MVQCSGCGRSFNEKAYTTHSRICAKVFQTKRRQFNAAEARIADSEAAKFFDAGKGRPQAEAVGSASGFGKPGRASKAQPRATRQASREDEAVGGKGAGQAPTWKQHSEQLRMAMRATKGTAAGFGSLVGVPAAPDESLIPCPHCGRRYNETAAERHIPKCRDIINKPTRLNAHGGKAAYMRGGANANGSPSTPAWGPARRGR